MIPSGKYIVGGLGITGRSVCEYLKSVGCEVVGFDERPASEFTWTKELADAKTRFYFETFPPEEFLKCLGLFISPGVSLTRPWLQGAKQLPILGELEFASRLLKGTYLAVTGTNGKSTTVSLLSEILTAQGLQTALKGNIGSPLLAAVRETPKDFYVIEASSYQLETISTFHPKVAVMMNVTADHLDRYNGMEDYAKAKERITQNQTADDFFVYNADDPYALRMAKRTKAKAIPFSLVNHFEVGGFADKTDLVIRLPSGESRYPLAKCNLKGLHNQENMLAAVLSAALVGATPEVILKTLQTFKGLPHRLEEVGVFSGVSYFDDSKGTNVGSVVMSLASFSKDVILILGGKDKGGDYAPLAPLIRGKVKHLVCMGEARDIISKALGNIVPTTVVETMKEAVQVSKSVAKAGDTVLLSPACSSFDQYKNYKERGDDFQNLVRT